MTSISSFNKNDDGTIQYVVSDDGKEVFNQKIVPGGDVDFKTPDGKTAKIHFQLKGDTIESQIVFEDGTKLHMDRVFEGNTMKQVSTFYKLIHRHDHHHRHPRLYKMILVTHKTNCNFNKFQMMITYKITFYWLFYLISVI